MGYTCDWCGKIVVGELFCEDYTGVCGSVICEECQEALFKKERKFSFSEEQIAQLKEEQYFRLVGEFTGQLLKKGNIVLLESQRYVGRSDDFNYFPGGETQ